MCVFYFNLQWNKTNYNSLAILYLLACSKISLSLNIFIHLFWSNRVGHHVKNQHSNHMLALAFKKTRSARLTFFSWKETPLLQSRLPQHGHCGIAICCSWKSPQSFCISRVLLLYHLKNYYWCIETVHINRVACNVSWLHCVMLKSDESYPSPQTSFLHGKNFQSPFS